MSAIAKTSASGTSVSAAATITSWTLVGASLFWSLILGPYTGTTGAQPLFLLALPFALLHGVRRYGIAGITAFFGVTFLISNALESCSIHTGFPFGHYHYTIGPKLFEVPLVVGIFYIAIAYASWQTANVLLGRQDEQLKRPLDVVALPVVAAFVMTIFDLTIDPTAATLTHTWIWEEGGAYFGVPYTNFLGWLLTTYLFFQAFTLYLSRSGRAVRRIESKGFWLQPLIIYVNLGTSAVTNVVTNAFGSETVTDARGTIWQVRDITESMMVVFMCSMLVVFLIAGLRLLRSPAEGE